MGIANSKNMNIWRVGETKNKDSLEFISNGNGISIKKSKSNSHEDEDIAKDKLGVEELWKSKH